MLTWQDITVQQFQDIYRLIENKSLDDMQRLEKVVAVLFDKTEKEVDEMSIQEFTRLSKECSFVLNMETIPGRPVKYIKVNGRKYFIQYNPKKLLSNMRHRQYVELTHFAENAMQNVHSLLASIVQPVRYGFFKVNNTAAMHERIAEDILQARFIDAYHAAVFFCKLLNASMKAIGDCLSKDMMKTMSPQEADLIRKLLQSAMDGFIPLNRSPKWKA